MDGNASLWQVAGAKISDVRYRAKCVVPFCNHSKGFEQQGVEWICGDHWRLVPRRVRQIKFKRFRQEKLANEKFRALYDAQGSRYTDEQFRAVKEAMDAATRAWERCKRQAIERAVGI